MIVKDVVLTNYCKHCYVAMTLSQDDDGTVSGDIYAAVLCLYKLETCVFHIYQLMMHCICV